MADWPVAGLGKGAKRGAGMNRLQDWVNRLNRLQGLQGLVNRLQGPQGLQGLVNRLNRL